MNILKKVGTVLLKIVTFGAVTAYELSPVITTVFGPAAGSLVSQLSQSILRYEAAAKADGKDKAGTEKMAAVLKDFTAFLPEFEKEFNLTVPAEKQAIVAQSVYNIIEALQDVDKTAAVIAAPAAA